MTLMISKVDRTSSKAIMSLQDLMRLIFRTSINHKGIMAMPIIVIIIMLGGMGIINRNNNNSSGNSSRRTRLMIY